MANKFRGEAELVYERETEDGPRSTTKKLAFDANAFCDIEEATGANLGEMLTVLADPKKMSMRMVRGIVYGGLQRHHPTPNIQEGLVIAGDIISDAGLQEVIEVIHSAVSGAMAKQKGGGSGKATGKAPARQKATG